ncbi:hypothetical protein PVK06_019976 [Gossypium arboreum]|uniref:Uncharacterized protein n=1 Tax=Gossypium arboreum TaxID=29729 RepID=A0ABR0PL76_GOSAR|nr:hypothetical protein PVK06_019976 [Gossypium arboreum]
MNKRIDIPAATIAAATDVSDAITAYSIATTIGFAKVAQSSKTKYATETSSISSNIKFLASIVSITESYSGDIIKIVIVRKCSLDHVDNQATAVTAINAFLLTRCRSTPTKSWLEETNKAEEDEKEIMGVNKI